MQMKRMNMRITFHNDNVIYIIRIWNFLFFFLDDKMETIRRNSNNNNTNNENFLFNIYFYFRSFDMWDANSILPICNDIPLCIFYMAVADIKDTHSTH